jgi:hypothetical protein
MARAGLADLTVCDTITLQREQTHASVSETPAGDRERERERTHQVLLEHVVEAELGGDLIQPLHTHTHDT